ncbi:MAG TPA: dUTP diphosphatase [Dehalococcoidia bacterium]|nr:dUTP diphosphatase [Dehalococcoidia bacterium]
MSAGEPCPAVRVVRLRPGARLPSRATPGSTGFDLYACIPDPGFIDVGSDPVLVPTGVAIEIPTGYDAQIRPRSGLSARGVIATFGTLDSDYRGEVFVTLYCVGSAGPYRVHDGDRIAQLVITRLADLPLVEVDALSETERGAAGHGSTGR